MLIYYRECLLIFSIPHSYRPLTYIHIHRKRARGREGTRPREYMATIISEAKSRPVNVRKWLLPKYTAFFPFPQQSFFFFLVPRLILYIHSNTCACNLSILFKDRRSVESFKLILIFVAYETIISDLMRNVINGYALIKHCICIYIHILLKHKSSYV